VSTGVGADGVFGRVFVVRLRFGLGSEDAEEARFLWLGFEKEDGFKAALDFVISRELQ